MGFEQKMIVPEKNKMPAESLSAKQCLGAIERAMQGNSPNKMEAYIQAITEMLTMRSEFSQLKKETGGDMVTLAHKFKDQMRQYREDFLPQISSEVENSGMRWESNPGWFGINTCPEASGKDGLNHKAYLTVPSGEYAFVKHVPELAQKLRKLATQTDDKIQVKIPNGFMAFMAHNDSIVIHCKKQENAEAALAIAREWMSERGIHEAPRELGRTQLAADSTSESFTQMVAKNIAQWLTEHEGRYDQKMLAQKAVEHAIAYSQKPPTVTRG